MTLALSAMDPTVQGIFFLVAFILFLITALFMGGYAEGEGRTGYVTRVNFVALGLAFFAVPFLWNAFAAS